MLEKIGESLSNIDGFFTRVGEVFSDPCGELMKFLFDFFKDALELTASISYDWLVVIGVIGLIFWIFGSEKGKKVATLSPIVYLVLQILAKVICHA